MSGVVDRSQLSTHATDFIDEPVLNGLLLRKTDAAEVRDVIAKSLAKEPLTLEETAALLAADAPELIEADLRSRTPAQTRRLRQPHRALRTALRRQRVRQRLRTTARFRRSNREPIRRTLTETDLRRRSRPCIAKGTSGCILVFGEHPRYNPAVHRRVRPPGLLDPRSATARSAASTSTPLPSITTATPTVKAAGIGTYQIFQETYHHATYAAVHPARHAQGRLPLASGRRSPAPWRPAATTSASAPCSASTTGASRSSASSRHALHLQEHYGVGPHTISFPRLRPATGVELDDHVPRERRPISNALVAILRLAVPYTGLILTARETADLRREVMRLRRLPDRRRQPHRTRRLHRGRRRPAHRTRAVPTRRHPLARRSHRAS